MKNIRHFVVIVTAFLTMLSSVSCERDDTIAYSEAEICSVVNGRLLSDGGYYFNIVENEAKNPDFSSYRRVIVVCDVLRKTEGKDNEYDIRLLNVYKVAISSPVSKSTLGQDIRTDAAGVQSAWLGGDYLNVNVQYTAVKESSVTHDLALVYDDVRSHKDTLFFELIHDAHNECYDNKEIEASKISVIGDYISYPIEEIVPAGIKKTVINIKWTWFLTQDGYLIRDTYTSEGNIIYTEE